VDLPYAAEAARSLIGTWSVGETMQHLGSENVNGYRCEKIAADMGGARITRWHSPKLGFDLRREVVKTSQGQQTQMEEYRVKECNLPDSLFEVPKGYRKVAAPTVP
jgi:hypothetical protein